MWHARSQLQRPSNDNINNIAQESGFLRQEIGEGAGSAVPSPHRMGVVRQRVAQASAPSCPARTSLALRNCPRFWRMDGGADTAGAQTLLLHSAWHGRAQRCARCVYAHHVCTTQCSTHVAIKQMETAAAAAARWGAQRGGWFGGTALISKATESHH